MTVTIWIEASVAQAGIGALVILVGIGSVVYLRHQLFPRQPL